MLAAKTASILDVKARRVGLAEGFAATGKMGELMFLLRSGLWFAHDPAIDLDEPTHLLNVHFQHVFAQHCGRGLVAGQEMIDEPHGEQIGEDCALDVRRVSGEFRFRKLGNALGDKHNLLGLRFVGHRGFAHRVVAFRFGKSRQR